MGIFVANGGGALSLSALPESVRKNVSQ